MSTDTPRVDALYELLDGRIPAIQFGEMFALARQLERELSAQWRPIETAPKDGTEVDVFCISVTPSDSGGYRVANAWWSIADQKWRAYDDGNIAWTHPPTHWMPLPPPPKG